MGTTTATLAEGSAGTSMGVVDATPTNASIQLRRAQDALDANPNAIVCVLPDEVHRRRLQKAVEKQIKNAGAAKGTLSALDDTDDPHLGDITRTLENIHRILINTRPAGHQLDGTPLGAAMREGAARAQGQSYGNGQTAPATPTSPTTQLPTKKGTGRKGKKRGGDPTQIGTIAEELVVWATSVPEPRPNPGTVIRSPSGAETEVVEPIGYDIERAAFRVKDSDGWDGFVFYHADANEWRLLSQALEYPVEPVDAEPNDSGDASSDDDSSDESRDGDLSRETDGETDGETLGTAPDSSPIGTVVDVEEPSTPGDSQYRDARSEPDAPRSAQRSASSKNSKNNTNSTRAKASKRESEQTRRPSHRAASPKGKGRKSR